MSIPASLEHRLEHFHNSGRVLRYAADLFAQPNWLAVLLGQEIWPRDGDPLVLRHGIERLRAELERVRATLEDAARHTPGHAEFIALHCRAPGLAAMGTA
jgi:tryptophan halogenase